MHTFVFNKDGSGYSFGVEFTNGNGALRNKYWKTRKAAEQAASNLKEHCGTSYEKNDFPWVHMDPKTGTESRLFRHVTTKAKF